MRMRRFQIRPIYCGSNASLRGKPIYEDEYGKFILIGYTVFYIEPYAE